MCRKIPYCNVATLLSVHYATRTIYMCKRVYEAQHYYVGNSVSNTWCYCCYNAWYKEKCVLVKN